MKEASYNLPVSNVCSIETEMFHNTFLKLILLISTKNDLIILYGRSCTETVFINLWINLPFYHRDKCA